MIKNTNRRIKFDESSTSCVLYVIRDDDTFSAEDAETPAELMEMARFARPDLGQQTEGLKRNYTGGHTVESGDYFALKRLGYSCPIAIAAILVDSTLGVAQIIYGARANWGPTKKRKAELLIKTPSLPSQRAYVALESARTGTDVLRAINMFAW